MPSNRTTGLLLDADYILDEKGEISIRIYVKTKKGIESFFDKDFKPYFYIITEAPKEVKDFLEKNPIEKDGCKIEILKVESVSKSNEKNVLKVYFKNTEQLVKAREAIEDVKGVLGKREYDIPFSERYLIDKNIETMNYVVVEHDAENKVKSVTRVDKKYDAFQEFNIGCFDLETSAPGRFSNPEKDPVIMIAYSDGNGSEVLSTKKAKGVTVFEDEGKMINYLVSKINENALDGIVTYNGDNFDFPYLIERAKRLNLKLGFGVAGEKPVMRKRGMNLATKVRGRQHIDAYQLVRILVRFGGINLVKYDLESVVSVLFGKKKEKLSAERMMEIWDSGKGMEELVNYNKEDAEYTRKIVVEYLPLLVEMSKLVKQSVYNVCRASAGSLVESLLMQKAFEKNSLIPNRPKEAEIRRRIMQTFKGGYVKEPISGLHENIAVLDFRSLHPSIIISHNISPETLNCKCCKGEEKNLAPTEDWFCDKEKGFFPSVLEELLAKRMEIKKELKTKEKGTVEYKALDARQHALKILLNSHYGYLAYARSRWYSRDAARAVTAWSRHYIKDTMYSAEEEGFTVIYGDTDSLLITLPNKKNIEDVKKFIDTTNKKLPGAMELELEGVFKRGIFVTKKEGGAAKKKYALIDYEDKLKIVGMEYVRRDWSIVAKETQRDVIEAVLKEGKPEKAAEIVKSRIKMLKDGKASKDKLVIMTQLQRSIDKYESIGPHVAAAKKAVAMGKQLEVGSVLSYVITRSGKTISEKAKLAEYVNEGDYDPDYYINNQLLPAVMKILAEFGYTEQDLIQGGKQQNLAAFG